MCIERSVGAGAANERADVAVIQVLLNFSRPAALPQLVADGRCGPMTIGAIREFQTRVLGLAAPDGQVAPNGVTLARLQAGLPAYDPSTGLSAARVQGIMPLALPARVALFAPGGPAA